MPLLQLNTVLPHYNASLHITQVGYGPQVQYTVQSKTVAVFSLGNKLENTLIT